MLATALDALNQVYYVVIPPTPAPPAEGRPANANAEGVFERFPEQLWLTSTDQLIRQIMADK